MAEFKIRIAGKVFAVRSLFESTRDYCLRYLTEENPDFFVETCGEDLRFEQEAAEEEAKQEGLRKRIFTDPFLERTSIQRMVAEHLIRCDTLLFHGSAVAVDGEGFLFTASCGTGKSTHTRLWREVFGQRAVMINDDKPFLRFTPEGVLICGAPWSGKHGLDANITVPLKGICILKRGEENSIHRIPADDALPMLLHQSQRPLEAELEKPFRHLVLTLSQTVPLWQMQCNMDPEAALVSYRAMSGKIGGTLCIENV